MQRQFLVRLDDHEALHLAKLEETRRRVLLGWKGAQELLRQGGMKELAQAVERYMERLPPVRTDREWLGAKIPRSRPSDREGFTR